MLIEAIVSARRGEKLEVLHLGFADIAARHGAAIVVARDVAPSSPVGLRRVESSSMLVKCLACSLSIPIEDLESHACLDMHGFH